MKEEKKLMPDFETAIVKLRAAKLFLESDGYEDRGIGNATQGQAPAVNVVKPQIGQPYASLKVPRLIMIPFPKNSAQGVNFMKKSNLKRTSRKPKHISSKK